jgi:uncharacterized membrane protein YoaK (UPF0700 family)
MEEIPLAKTHSTAILMSGIAGFVDVFAFVAVSRLFTAHITGNIVIAIAEIIYHSPSFLSKLIALPVFMLIAMITAAVIEHFGRSKRLLSKLFLLEAVLLTAFMVIGAFVVPQGDVRSWQYIFTGMIAVSAMAVHNTLLRTFMTSFPPCTVMTGNFCQFTVDLVSYYFGKKLAYPLESLKNSLKGIKIYGSVLVSFCIGGILAAIGVTTIGFWMLTPIILTLTYLSYKSLKRY